MNFIDSIKKRAKEDIKTIVLPESMDRRVLEAAVKVMKEDIAKVIIIGTEEDMAESSKGLDLSSAIIINPKTNDMTTPLIDQLVELRREKGMTREEALNYDEVDCPPPIDGYEIVVKDKSFPYNALADALTNLDTIFESDIYYD